MLTVLLIAGPLLVVAGVTTLLAVLRAPDGYEDDSCFHHGPRSFPAQGVDAPVSLRGH
ncbi:MAG: hypothetical protein WCQ89_09285 [Verrucomicrobiota bacterium]|jgi:hypothetical protein